MNIFREMTSALCTEQTVVLCTVIATSGSTPAAALSRMLLTGGGTTWHGTVGGGCMEGEVLEKAQQALSSDRASILTFHLTEDDIPHGLICGGTLDVLIEPLTQKHLGVFAQLNERIEECRDSILATKLSSNGVVEFKVVVPIEGSDGLTPQVPVELGALGIAGMKDESQRAFKRSQTLRIAMPTGEVILEPVQGEPDLVVFGGGHVSRHVSRIARLAGFRVTIVDDRDEYANPVRFPDATETIVAEFYEAFTKIRVMPRTFLVIVTRGHWFDEVVLESAVKTRACYIGMIGSRRKVLAAYNNLVHKGVSVKDIERVHAPMGIDIGAVTAEEIAVSIVSELIQVRRHAASPAPSKSEVMKPLLLHLE